MLRVDRAEPVREAATRRDLGRETGQGLLFAIFGYQGTDLGVDDGRSEASSSRSSCRVVGWVCRRCRVRRSRENDGAGKSRISSLRWDVARSPPQLADMGELFAPLRSIFSLGDGVLVGAAGVDVA